MSEQDTTNRTSPSTDGFSSGFPDDFAAEQQDHGSADQMPRTERTEYHRQTPHITQEPIDDIDTEYVMPNRYTTVDQASASHHKHMGVASSEPEYLPRTGPQVRERQGQAQDQGATQDGSAKHFNNSGKQSGTPDYSRYLETPKSGRSIFISPKERRRKRNQKIAAVVAVAAVVVIVVLIIVFS